MSQGFKDCIDRKALYRSPSVADITEKEFASAASDLNDAKFSLSEGRFKWAIIQAYYAMFHGARALLYSKGYKERSHRCVVSGIEHLFAKEGLLEMKWVRALENAMSMREEADYAGEFSNDGADATVSNAEGFVKEVERILKGD